MAPSTTSALHPIVIPPAQVPPHFTTLGTGLLHASHAREAAATLRTLLLSSPPLLENKGKPKPWWRAQCLLYGLDAPEKRTVQELRSSLELALLKGGLEVPTAIIELEHKENGKFRKLNAQVREATGAGAGEKKSKTVPKTAGGATASDTNKGKKAAPKDPLKVVRSAGKIAKSQPKKTAAPKNNPITVNLTVNLPPAPAPKAAGKKAQPKSVPAKPPPKPRAIKAATPSEPMLGTPTYFGLGGEQAEPKGKKPKQMPRGGTLKSESKPAPVKKEIGVPKAKQTARCSSRGGGSIGQNAPRVKKEVEMPVWPKQEDYQSGCDSDGYSNQYGDYEDYGYQSYGTAF